MLSFCNMAFKTCIGAIIVNDVPVSISKSKNSFWIGGGTECSSTADGALEESDMFTDWISFKNGVSLHSSCQCKNSYFLKV